MRIRKRPPVVRETTGPADAVPDLSVNVSLDRGDGEQLAIPSTCPCCSRLRQLEYWQLEELTQEDEEPSIGFADERQEADDNQASPKDDRERSVSEASENPGEVRSTVQEDEPNPKRDSEQRTNSSRGQVSASEGDSNHPGNKPKESLLYSLYCVFSKLSGKAVLTAREALSRILEHRLPGLDEDTGLPSVQVAKVMRSNPYFVHLEGGKFFLCSAPSTDSKDTSAGELLDTDTSSRPASPRSQPKVAPLKGLSSTDNAKKGRKQPAKTADGNKTKRARTSKGAPPSDDSTSNKLELPSSASKKGGRAAKTVQSTPSQNVKEEEEVREPLCKRYDGRGWKCNEKALEGYSMCRHHHELIVNRLARLRSIGKLGGKKSSKRRKTGGKAAKKGSKVADGELPAGNDRNGAHWWKNVKARSLKSINK